MWSVFNTGQISLKQPLGRWIEKYAADERFTRYLEVGSWNGRGSTVCFASGFGKRESGNVEFKSLEIHPDRVAESQAFWRWRPHVEILHARILPELPDVKSVHTDIVDDWQSEDEKYFKTAAFADMSVFKPEVVLLDGGEYITYFEYLALKDIAKVFLLDDTAVAKCKRVVQELRADPRWELVDRGTDRNGWAVYQTVQ